MYRVRGTTVSSPNTGRPSISTRLSSICTENTCAVQSSTPAAARAGFSSRCGNEGFEVDGCDASADMIERCRHQARDARLWVSTSARPRSAATIRVDRLQWRLRPWQQSRAGHPGCQAVARRAPPRRNARPRQRRTAIRLAGAGLERAFRRRHLVAESGRCGRRGGSVRPHDDCAEARDGRREEHALTMRFWYRDQLVPLLEAAGFVAVSVLPGSTSTRSSTSPTDRHSADVRQCSGTPERASLTRRIGVMSRRLARRLVWRQQGSSRRGSHPTSTTRCARSSVSATPHRLGACFTRPRSAKTERFESLRYGTRVNRRRPGAKGDGGPHGGGLRRWAALDRIPRRPQSRSALVDSAQAARATQVARADLRLRQCSGITLGRRIAPPDHVTLLGWQRD